ncbi:hypothetical protein B0H10DRAFT_2159734 [Mycena sp. CBHHK59/15]|nr:hypothetical protein B0H10DRAFT_2159734 [Mycena sp. CBHHK59/15]
MPPHTSSSFARHAFAMHDPPRAASPPHPPTFLFSRETRRTFSVSTPEPVLLKFAKTIYESPLILLLCANDAVSIGVAVLIVLTVGFVQEQRSEKSLEALTSSSRIIAMCCGQTIHILANELVPGDIVTFSTGDRIPADIRIASAVDLEIDESSLTGETEARRKNEETCVYDGGAVHCLHGTLVRNGASGPKLSTSILNAYHRQGMGIVIATGTDTEFGKRTPLQLSMDELAKKLSMISFGVIGVICLIGVLQHRPWLDMFTIGVSLAVAAIPEGLPIVTTVTLALGVLRMAKRKAIVKSCTPNFTKNEQTVTEAYPWTRLSILTHTSSLPPAIRKTFDIGALCNNALWHGTRGHIRRAVHRRCTAQHSTCLRAPDRRARLSERPFNSEQKYMSVSGIHTDSPTLVVNGNGSREMYYIKGSIDTVLERCKFYYVNDESTPGWMPTRAASSRDGMGAKLNLVFAGFQAMLDPPRKGVADSIGLLQAGGVQVVMITGDAEETALSIARALGLKVGSQHSHGGSLGAAYCLTGKAIDQMSKAQLKERVATVTVFARTTPRHKMAIVEPSSRGGVVAMTGDGGRLISRVASVNPADNRLSERCPALKMADIGVSMGKSGTDVAKEAADVILVDDNFSTILPAVEEGGQIDIPQYPNFLSFQLSTAAAALTLITLSTMLGLSNPLNAMQIFTGPPSQSLGVDPVDPAVMRRPPRKKDAPIITRRLLYRVLFSASIIVVGTLFVYIFALEDEKMSRREQTMTFTCFVFLDLVSAVQNRGIGCGLVQNKMLVTTVSISAISQLALVYVPFMQAIFQTAALDLSDLGVILALAGTSFALHEGRRRYEGRLNLDSTWAEMAEEMA